MTTSPIKSRAKGWYVLSGYAANDIFYRKVILDPSGLIQVLEISYPGSLKQSFDPVVSYMVQTFGPGTLPGVEPSVLAQPEGLPGVQVDKLKTPARNTALRSAPWTRPASRLKPRSGGRSSSLSRSCGQMTPGPTFRAVPRNWTGLPSTGRKRRLPKR